MSDMIRHEGVVESVVGDDVRVRIGQTSGCAACKLSGHCNASETQVKVIEAKARPGQQLRPGQAVTVSTSLTTGYRAVAWGFGLPLVVLVAVIVLVKVLTGDEALAALAGLAALVPYYLLVWLLRHRLSRRVCFLVEEI